MASGKIATAYVQVRPSMDGVASEVRKKFTDEGDKSGSLFGGNLTGKLKSVIAAAGIGKALGKSLTEGGALQQSLGGVETLFGSSCDRVINAANIAYRTAGLSANSYMENVTSFAASLLQSTGKNTAEAARIADMAMIDMSDNANKMGTHMEDIQNAYQGFAKQNYTMLDNLKLGYGGTKTEMERLLADAQKLTGVKYDISNLADVYQAIHVIQGELGITGTTAKEAEVTMVGSFNSMKASAENVLGHLALGDNIRPSLNALSETTSTFLVGNFLPMLGNIASGIPKAILPLVGDTFDQVCSDLSEKVPQLSFVFDNLESAIAGAAAAYVAFKAGTGVMRIIQGFQQAQVSVELLSMGIGQANLAQAAFNGTMTLGETVVALLTGKMSLSAVATGVMTAAQGALNAAMYACPVVAIAAALGGMAIWAHSSSQKVKELAASFTEQATTSEDAAQNLEDLKAKMNALRAEDSPWTMDKKREYEALKLAIADTEAQLEELLAKEAEAAAKAAAEAADPVNIFKEATEQYQEEAGALLQKFTETYEGIYNNVSSWFGPFEEASTSVTTSVDQMLNAMQSQIDFNNSYAANLQALADYGLGGLSTALQSCGKDGAAYADAIVSAVEKAGGAASDGGEKIIQDFKGISSELDASRANLSESMTTMSGDFAAAWADMNETYTSAIEGLDKGAEAQAAALATIESFKNGITSATPGVLEAVSRLGNQVAAALRGSIGTVNVPVTYTIRGSGGGGKPGISSMTYGSYATGLDYVPFDGFIAELHKGEMVVPAAQAEQLRGNGRTANTAATGTVSAEDTKIYRLLKDILDAVKAGRRLYLDGRALVGATANEYDGQMGQRRMLANRGAR